MFRKLSLFGVLLALVVIAVGSYLNLTNQGLGCENWPACYGQSLAANLNPANDAEVPVVNHPLLQQIHQYLAAGLGLWGLVLLIAALRLQASRGKAIVMSTLLLAVLGFQAWLGIVSLQLPYMPLILSAHQLLGFFSFWILAGLYLRLSPVLSGRLPFSLLNGLTIVAQVLLLLEIALGSWANNNLAGLSCLDFPRCNGQFLPEGDYLGALNILQGLAENASLILSESDRALVMALHRLLALVVFVVLSTVMLIATDERHPKPVRRAGSLLSFLLLLEIVLGVLSVKHILPLALVIAHNLTAALLMLPLLAINLFSRYGQSKQAVADAAVSSQPEKGASTQPAVPPSLYQRLSSQLSRTRGALGGLLAAKSTAGSLLEQIETSLLLADIGIETTNKIMAHLTATLDKPQLNNPELLIPVLKQHLFEILEPCSQPLTIPKQDSPYVILVVGVNGAGKTTSIGKLANRLQAQGYSVMLAAGDTFRAAAVEQLQTWGERNNIQVVAQHTGADSASVIFDALQSAQAKGVDVLIADTAGRLHTKSNLMDELKKVKRIMSKLDQAAPHEVLLILDAGTGQNALSQARLFDETVQLTGIALTKLDGTAKGGVIFALANQLQVPIRFIGVGEAIEDLQDFDARSFVDALFETGQK